MNKSQLISVIAHQNKLSKVQSKLIVDTILASVTQTLSEGDIVQLPGFGSFSLSYHPDKKGINPKTGQELIVAGRNKVAFKPGSQLKQKIKQNN